MNLKRRAIASVATATICVAMLATGLIAAETSELEQQAPVIVEQSAPVTPTIFDGDLRDLPPLPLWSPGDPVREIPRRFYPKPGMRQPDEPNNIDRLHEKQMESSGDTEGAGAFSTPTRSFSGLGFSGVNPPDPSGAVGPNHYIQSINGGGGALVRIFDKALPTPNVLADFAMDSLGTGQCAGGLGDPIVLYDRHAERWMLSEFSSSGNNLCMYISQTSDPVTGGWFAYQFSAPSFPDYPKYGTWPTDVNGGAGSYIVTANDGGPGIYAMDRGNMLAGNAATYQRFTIPGLPGFGFEAPTPADLDGPNVPPVGAPGIIMRHRDTESHSGPAAPEDLLEMWSYNVDWVDPGNTTLVQQTSIDVAEFDSSLCGLTSFNCFQQPGTGTTLDPLREVIMNRLQYFNHNDGFETLVGSYVVDVDGANTGGVRWFELRGGDGNWSLFQEGTYAPDSDSRFMSSPSMDQSQNIAVAYNISSSSTFPGLRYTGRLADDPAGLMTQTEGIIFDATASNGSNRYGDYSQMSLDPSDDCTFWFTGETNASSQWKTQIATFGFEACGCELFPSEPSLTGQTNGDNRIDLDWDDSDLETVSEYRVLRSRTPGGPYTKIATIADSTPGTAGGPSYSYSDFDVSGTVEYYYVIRSSDGAACTSPESNEISVEATGDCTLAPVFGGVDLVDDPEFGVCQLQLLWSAASPECGSGVTYNVYRSTDPNFVPGAGNLLASGITDTTFADLSQLVDGTVYHYAVRAVDDLNGEEEGNEKRLAGEPDGVGGGSCTTGSACSDNPFVDVNPEGPALVCQNQGPTLTADTVSGTGPFTYQWVEDGQPIAGAVSESFTPNRLGTHSYNVRVSSASCPDEVFDGLDTVLERVNKPFFGGATAAVNTQNAACTVDVLWNAASTPCDGPISYNVYRDTTSPVATTPQNLVAGGLTGTSYSDSFDLDDSQLYFYTVQAYDSSTGQSDGNNVVVAAAPDGPNNGLQDAYIESFNSAPAFANWSVTTGPGAHTCGEWGLTGAPGSRPSGGSGDYMIADNDCSPLLPRTSTTVVSPDINLVIPGIQSVRVEANLRFDFNSANGVETGKMEAWDGAQWVTLWSSTAGDFNQKVSFDVSAIALNNPAFKLRFDYQNAIADNYFSVDTVRVITDVLSTCVTPAAGPASVPRGSVSVTENGAGVDLNWDAGSCPSTNYNILYGDLANVGSYAIDGAICAVGSAGSFNWSSLPSGNLFFLLVGTDGSGTESSWGTNSGFGERNGGVASGECGVTQKDAANICD